MLQSRQTVARSRLVDERSIPTIDKTNGIAELVSRIRSRNLSIFDHSCTERLRNATTTPANPARATAICALVLNASLGCILDKIRFHPFVDKLWINIEPVHHRGTGIENLRRRSIGQKETEIARQNFMALAQPRAAVVVRHEIQLDQQASCFRKRL